MLISFLVLLQVRGAPIPVTAPRWNLTEELRIDGEAASLSAIGHVRVAANGTIAIAQPQDGLVKFFSPGGKLLGQFGRMGEGPGEFRAFPYFGGFAGDRMWLRDGANGQVTFLTSNFGFARSLIAPKQVKGPSGTLLRGLKTGGVMFPTPDKQLVYRIALGILPEDKFWTDLANGRNLLFVRVSEEGQYLGKIVAMNADPVCPLSPDITLPQSQFCGDARVDPTPDGSKIFILESLQAFPTQPDRFRVTSLSLQGDTLFSKLLGVAPKPIPKATIDSIRAAKLRASPAKAELINSVKFPSHFAPADRLLAGIDGTVWIRLAQTAQGWPWLALDAQGGFLGMVVLPGKFTPQAASKTNLWVIESDEDGVESVVRFRIR